MNTGGESENPVPLLEVRGLCKDFRSGGLVRNAARGKLRALDSVDMEVHPGEIRGIVGESGSGKTTLARCCLRLLEPSSGSVFFDGHNLASYSSAALRAKRREFQMVFQDPSALNSSMTVEDLILEPLRIHKIGTPDAQMARLRKLMDAVSLNGFLMKRKPSELSGGQQQRVGIARAIALGPRLLIADEPVSSLDASVQAQILNLLADLTGKYTLTLILISHSLFVIHYLCTRISVLYRGRIVEEAPAEVFFEKPKHPYSRLLLDSMPALSSSLPDRTGQSGPTAPESRHVPRGCAFHPRCPRSFALCRAEVPPLKEVASGEKVACFLYF